MRPSRALRHAAPLCATPGLVPRPHPARARTQDALTALLLDTRPDASDAPAAATARAALRGAAAARLPGWLHGLPADQGQRVKELVLVAMAELEHLSPQDRVRLSGCCLSGLEEGRPHATAVLQLLPPCLLLIPPGAAGGGSQGGGTPAAADAVEGAQPGTPPAEPSSAHRWG
jgi:hypothetical protein